MSFRRRFSREMKGGDDGLDNEIITVDLNRINPNVSKIFFFLNNVGAEDFSQNSIF